MRAQDIVNQLAILLPALTDKFTTDFSVASLSRSGTTVTVTTDSDHDLKVGSQANIVGAKTPISIGSMTRSGVTGTLVTDTNHDMTEDFSVSIETSGSTEAEFNGTFIITSVLNRKTIEFTMIDSGPTLATGSPLLLNGASALQQYNGLKNVTAVPTSKSFQYEVADSSLGTPAAGTIVARTLPRLSAAVSLERLLDSYTKTDTGKLWAFVVLNDVFASKDRATLSDATSNLQRGEEWRQQIVQPFAIYLFIPTNNEIAARASRDTANDLLRSFCQSLLGSKFDSGLSVGKQNPVQFLDHGFVVYNTAYYVHVYNFQQVADLIFEDTVGHDLDVAFRDISLSMGLDVGTGQDPLTMNIDLDEVPL